MGSKVPTPPPDTPTPVRHDMVWVLRPGMKVMLAGDVPAVVAQVIIMADFTIQYQCVWWSGRERKTDWLWKHEVTPAEDKGVAVGFHNAH